MRQKKHKAGRDRRTTTQLIVIKRYVHTTTRASRVSLTRIMYVQMSQATGSKKTSSKRNYMLHDATTMKPVGRFASTTSRGAAMKAASRGYTTILLRETGTKKIHKYAGEKVELEKPREVNRDGKIITYKYASVVKADGKPYIYEGHVDETTDVPENPKA